MSLEVWGTPPEVEERLSVSCEVEECEDCPGAGEEEKGSYEHTSGEFDEHVRDVVCPCSCHHN